MILAWLLLYLVPLVHQMGLYGWDPKGAQALVLLPMLALPGLLALQKRWPDLFGQRAQRTAGLAAGVLALGLVRTLILQPVDLKVPATSVHLAVLGLTTAWVAVGSRSRAEGPGDALWAGAWLLTGLLDPVVPFLGAGVAALLRGFDLWPSRPGVTAPDLPAFVPALLLGLALPKAHWDFGQVPGSAWGPACAGLGLALARLKPLDLARPGLRRGLLTLLGLCAVLYHPVLIAPWGLVLGLAAGWTLPRTGQRLGALAGGLLLGLGLSFALHANAWIPGLRHLIWLGN